jgi:hypothetical protein
MASMRCRNEFGKYRGTVESGLLPGNPIGQVQWRAPSAAATVNPAVVASSAQVRAMLPRSPASSRTWPRSSAACITRRYAPKKPSPYVTMTSAPAHGRGKTILTVACPRTGSAWISAQLSRERPAPGLRGPCP